jgi:glycosyltransferase involved in cell wall biosynthesis
MNFLFVTTASITAEAFLLELANDLKIQGNNVEFAFSFDKFTDARSSVKKINEMGFKTHCIPFARDIKVYNDIFAFFRILKLLKRNNFDIVHSHTSKAGFITRLASVFISKSYFIHTSHDFYFREFKDGFRRTFFIILEKIAARFCDKIFFVSNEVLNDAISYKIASSDKCIFVSNGININQDFENTLNLKKTLSLKDDTIIVGTVARLVKNKGLDIFIETARELVNKNNNYFFIICGNGPEKEYLSLLINKYNLINHIYFFDFFNEKNELYQVVKNFDVFLFPTLREGLGLVILESMLLEVPVVTTNLAPMNEIIQHKYNGLLSFPGDSKDFASCVQTIVNNTEFSDFIVKNGYKTVLNKYDLNRVNFKIINLYNNLLK